ncbi:ABC transporter permease [Atlantibacter hermannii]|uniref:ABC transporter permease n=1 Tax=Atlantibacter hermannii TaxID=565 RepID=UPI0028A90748|nr:ABC transporter permease [Atlantibacter hermannii]
MNSYLKGVWESRYFWIHLSLSDLRSRWRRSFFGVLWSILQPLGITILISIVFGKMFNSPITTYAPYILSGILIWDYLITCVTGGSLSFVQADAYIKQCNHPLAIYTLRTVCTATFILGLASVSLLGWVLVVLPHNFGLCWIAALSIFPLLILLAWPLSTILAYIGVRFRDVPHALALVMQGLWFISPVYFETKIFRSGGLHVLIDYNPVYHLLQIVRAPLLQGEWPTLVNYQYVLGTALVFMVIAVLMGRKMERKVIFYL